MNATALSIPSLGREGVVNGCYDYHKIRVHVCMQTKFFSLYALSTRHHSSVLSRFSWLIVHSYCTK